MNEKSSQPMPQMQLSPRLIDNLSKPRTTVDASAPHTIGVLLGEGVGPEVVPVALKLLATLEQHSTRRFHIITGGLIGYPAIEQHGKVLTDDVVNFASKIFNAGGALFCGPGGQRFVYELRREFDLFCKFTPLEPFPELARAGVVRSEAVQKTDIIAVRENSAGLYQGNWTEGVNSDGHRFATHCFEYNEQQVKEILEVAMRLAAKRRNRLHVVLKPGGAPSISKLWQACTKELSCAFGVECFEQEIDNAVYQLIADPSQFDVIVSPNMFGDVLADCGGLLLASRGLSYSGNFDQHGRGVYQTGHGAARDIAGKGVANPIAQILSLGMMLRESFDWPEADAILRETIRQTLRDGYCTADIPMPHCVVCSTDEFGEQLRIRLVNILEALNL